MLDQRNMLDQTKMTAPIPAVGAAGEQSENKKSNDIIPKDRKNNNSLHTLSMTELYDTTYPPKAAIIDGLLYAGTYLFVGAPKIGKSFFMAQLSYHIATGTSLWQYDVHPGEVLYLALEDDYARIQKRLYKMFGSKDTPNLHFATQSMTLGGGLLDQLETFLAHHPETRLMIVDTLQKIREIGSDKYNYANDYEIVGRLKAFSDRHNLCLLIVHHTRKMESEDSFDMISGTNGLLGAAGRRRVHPAKEEAHRHQRRIERCRARPAGSGAAAPIRSRKMRLEAPQSGNRGLANAARPRSPLRFQAGHAAFSGMARHTFRAPRPACGRPPAHSYTDPTPERQRRSFVQ